MATHNFFASPVEAELVSLHPRKQGPDDDRVLVYDMTVDVMVPTMSLCLEINSDLGHILFAYENLFNWVNPTLSFKRHDIAIGFEPITSEDDEGVAIFIPGAVVKLKKAWPGEPAKLRFIFTWEPDSKRDVSLVAEQLEEPIWLVAEEFVKEENTDESSDDEDGRDDDGSPGAPGDGDGAGEEGSDGGGS